MPKTVEALSGHGVWGDVRDLAEAHVRSLEKEKAGGERMFVLSGSFIWQDWGTFTSARAKVVEY